jgi:hypothetical protein
MKGASFSKRVFKSPPHFHMKGASFSKRVFKSVAHKTQNLAAAATAAKANAAAAEATTTSTTVRSHVGSSFLGGHASSCESRAVSSEAGYSWPF